MMLIPERDLGPYPGTPFACPVVADVSVQSLVAADEAADFGPVGAGMTL